MWIKAQPSGFLREGEGSSVKRDSNITKGKTTIKVALHSSIKVAAIPRIITGLKKQGV